MPEATPPQQVRKRDGRVVEFDAGRISLALFAASETVGQPDAFLARELTDAIVHFLTQESDGEVVPTQEIAETVVKVVREMGQPVLAAAFEQHGRIRTRRPAGTPLAAPDSELSLRFPRGTSLAKFLVECSRRYTLQTVYTRDLAAAQEAGLLTLTGLETPNELAGCVPHLPITGDGNVVAALEQTRLFVGREVALDGLEHLALITRQTPHDLAQAVVLGLRLTGLAGVVNLDIAVPPTWAANLAQGPLFAVQAVDPARRQILADELLAEWVDLASPALRIDWHLGKASFAENESSRLLRVAGHALAGIDVGFVFDRPRRPVALGEGLDRSHPATLLAVGLHLPELARQRGLLSDVDRFCESLGSLVRLALGAAVQKRRFLHEQERKRTDAGPALTSGFLLDRARFVVTPVGLDEVVNLFTDWGLSNGGASLELGRRIVQRLHEVLRRDGRLAQMDVCLDGPATFGLSDPPAQRDAVAGLTPWDVSAAPRSQLRAAGVLQGVAEHGTLALLLPRDEVVEPAQLVECLHSAWKQPEVVRLRVVRR